jgi:hypothetical protein
MIWSEMDFPVEKVNWVDCYELSKYLFEEYHVPVDVLKYYAEQYDYTRGNDSYVTAEVSRYGVENIGPEEWTSEAGIQLVERWLTGTDEVNVDLLLWHQWYLGKIPEGTYYIQYWW